jgi:hypothetical protein
MLKNPNLVLKVLLQKKYTGDQKSVDIFLKKSVIRLYDLVHHFYTFLKHFEA